MSRERASIVVAREGLSWVARAGMRTVGRASAWHDSDNRFVILHSIVSKPFRRRGVARAMYETIERDTGKTLSPAISLSDDAFEFWKRFRPEAVALDLRHRPELVGCKVEKGGRFGAIISVSGSIAMVRYDGTADGEADSQTCVRRADLEKYLLPTDSAEEEVSAPVVLRERGG